MAKRTKKVGPAGRFQARYGVRTRTITKNIEIVQKAKHKCPSCGYQKVKRIGTSIWRCRKCGIEFTGGAYIPTTEAGQNVEKMLKGEFELPEVSTEEPKEVESKGEKK